MISVKVVSEKTGKSLQGISVSISFSSFLRGITSTIYTDCNGEAHFDVEPGEGTVYVRGTAVEKGYLSGKVVIYIKK